jgi:hypothetical protein
MGRCAHRSCQREGDFGHIFDSETDRVALERTLSSVEKNLGSDGLQSALAAGRAMTLDAASEYLERAAGPPRRLWLPSIGPT